MHFIKLSSPVVQAALLLLGSAILAASLAFLHPQRKTISELSSIPLLTESSVSHLSVPAIRVAAVTSSRPNDAVDVEFAPGNWDAQVENLAALYHGDEHILVVCRSFSCEEGWALAKRLRRYGFPEVALIEREVKP